MKITDIEIIPIVVPVAERYDNHHGRIRMGGIDQRLFVKIHTDNGLVGYGDYEGVDRPPPQLEIDRLIGRNPFDFINNSFNPAIGMALYDVMGKHLEVPAYKLMGQKLRDAVSVAAWTRPCPPEVFRGEIERAVAQGYSIFKMHTSDRYDVFEQCRLASEVAPEGFKIHWDFTGRRGRTVGTVLPIIAEIEREYPIVGYIEDPLDQRDLDGWSKLRQRTQLPIVHGGAPALGGMQELLHGVADIYMIGGSIGNTLALGHAYGLANMQCLLQQTGGTLTKALTLHMACVLPTATAHSVILDDQYDEDITTETIPVTEGFSRVPEGPGLGFEIDEDALARAAARRSKPLPRIVSIVHLPGGTRIYSARHANIKRITGREEGAIRGINVEQWEDDGSEEFDRIYERVTEEAKARGERVT